MEKAAHRQALLAAQDLVFKKRKELTVLQTSRHCSPYRIQTITLRWLGQVHTDCCLSQMHICCGFLAQKNPSEPPKTLLLLDVVPWNTPSSSDLYTCASSAQVSSSLSLFPRSDIFTVPSSSASLHKHWAVSFVYLPVQLVLLYAFKLCFCFPCCIFKLHFILNLRTCLPASHTPATCLWTCLLLPVSDLSSIESLICTSLPAPVYVWVLPHCLTPNLENMGWDYDDSLWEGVLEAVTVMASHICYFHNKEHW